MSTWNNRPTTHIVNGTQGNVHIEPLDNSSHLQPLKCANKCMEADSEENFTTSKVNNKQLLDILH